MLIQVQFLNHLLQSGDASLLLMNNLNEDFFSDYKDEYRFIVDHLSLYNKLPDQYTFLEKFPSFDIIEVKEPDSYLINALYEDRRSRLVASTFNNVRDLMLAGKTDDAVSLLSESVNSLVSAKHIEAVDIIQDTSRYDAYVERCNDFSKYYVKTGFSELDELIGGWDRLEELATIAARPGVGKSWILLKTAIAAVEQGLNVGIYSGEMSEWKVGYRFDTLTSHISNYSISKGHTSIQNEYKKHLDSLKTRYKGSLKILTPAMIDGPAGVTALRAFIEKEHLDMLCVDQHSLLEDDRKARTPVEKAANISRDLKNLQVLKKIPIIAVSQQNRTSSEGGITTAHIAQSDRISQDSTVVLFLEQKDGILTINLTKCRDAENGKKLNYAVDLNKGIFTYIPDEENPEDFAKIEELRSAYEEIDTDIF